MSALPDRELPPARETLLARARADLEWLAANGLTADLEYLAVITGNMRRQRILADYAAEHGTWPPALDAQDAATAEHVTAPRPEQS